MLQDSKAAEGQKPHSGDGTLEEYKILNADAQAYRQQRNVVLAIAVAGFASLLGFGGTDGVSAVVLGLFAIVTSGAAITWECTYQAHKRETYISAIIESQRKDMHWNSVAPTSQYYLLFGRWKLDNDIIPSSYPCVYAGLGLTGLAFAFASAINDRTFSPAIIGFLCLAVHLGVVWALHYESLNKSYRAKVDEWRKTICASDNSKEN